MWYLQLQDNMQRDANTLISLKERIIQLQAAQISKLQQQLGSAPPTGWFYGLRPCDASRAIHRYALPRCACLKQDRILTMFLLCGLASIRHLL